MIYKICRMDRIFLVVNPENLVNPVKLSVRL
jgi:hypothetical protein